MSRPKDCGSVYSISLLRYHTLYQEPAEELWKRGQHLAAEITSRFAMSRAEDSGSVVSILLLR